VRINVAFLRVRDTIFGRGKAIIITYSDGVSVTLVIQRAKRMRRITGMLSSVA
jgi:hypothetical protein